MWSIIGYCLFIVLPIDSSYDLSDTKKPSIFISVKRSEKEIFVNSIVNGLFTSEVLDGINRGFTSCVEYTVELWWNRVLWFDELVQREKFTFFVNYDIWNKEYKIRNVYGDVTSFDNFEEVLYKICVQDNISICAVDALSRNKTYYVVVSIVLKPLSTENLNDIINYARGEIKEIKKKEKLDIFFHLLGQAKNFAGLGDRVVTGKSEPFRWK